MTVRDIVEGNGARLGDDGVWVLEKGLNRAFVIDHFADSHKSLVLDNGCFSIVLACLQEEGYCDVVYSLHLSKDKGDLVLE